MTTHKERAYAYIRSRLLSGDLPPGARLSNRKLASEIGMSFIPVREAISQLASEGLVDHRPGLGSFVLHPRADDITDLYDLREALECHAVTRAAERITAAELDEMERRNRELQGIVTLVRGQRRTRCNTEQAERWRHADASLHLTLMQASGNARMMQAVSDLRIVAGVVGRLWNHGRLMHLEAACEEHERLIAALRRRDAAAARATLSEHIRRSSREAARTLDRTDGAPEHAPAAPRQAEA